MDVTPLEVRGVSASSGEGVKPHGRDTSQPVVPTSNDEYAKVPAPNAPAAAEPKSVDVDRMANALARVLPHLEEDLAKVIAENVLRHLAPKPAETETPKGKTLDVSA